MDKLHRKKKKGIVVSDKMDKTVVVKVLDLTRHPTYGKVVKRIRKFYAHDEKNLAKIGDTVTIMETRPLSRLKRWVIKSDVLNKEVSK